MQHDGVQSYRSTLRIDRSFRDFDAITHSNIVRKFWLQFKLHVPTFLLEA